MSIRMNVTDQLWYDEQAPSDPPTLPMALCAGTDCSVGATSRNQLFLSKPLTPASGGIPVFSVRPAGEDGWVGTLGILGSANAADSRSMVIEKDRVDPGQPLRFYLMNGITDSDPGMYVTAVANLTGGDSALHYTITGTASREIPEFSVIPRIYKQTSAGDVLIYTIDSQKCPPGETCTIRGDFVPVWDISNITSLYFANTTIVYTLPSPIIMDGVEIRQAAIDDARDGGSPPAVPEVVVTGELSPLEPGKNAVPANVNNTVPWGGTIEHVMKGDVPITVVYNAIGQPQFVADDRKNVMISRPDGKNQSATFIHIVPNGSIVAHIDNNIDNNGEFVTVSTPTNEKILSVINQMNTSADPKNRIVAWIEWADDSNTDNITSVSARWKVPGVPVKQTTGAKWAIFNSIRPKDRSRILQPVLEWQINSLSYVWTSCPWDYTDGVTKDTWKGYRNPVKVSDTLEGSMTWDSAKNGWLVKMYDVTDGNVSSFTSTNVTTNLDLSTEIVLESTGTGVDETNEFPKNIVFDTLTYKNASGDAPITLTKHINSDAKNKWSSLDVVITTDTTTQKPTKVELQTPRGIDDES
jgi:hypothetical protein